MEYNLVFKIIQVNCLLKRNSALIYFGIYIPQIKKSAKQNSCWCMGYCGHCEQRNREHFFCQRGRNHMQMSGSWTTWHILRSSEACNDCCVKGGRRRNRKLYAKVLVVKRGQSMWPSVMFPLKLCSKLSQRHAQASTEAIHSTIQFFIMAVLTIRYGEHISRGERWVMKQLSSSTWKGSKCLVRHGWDMEEDTQRSIMRSGSANSQESLNKRWMKCKKTKI